MKKLITALCMVLVAMGAQAVQIWSGSVTLSNYTRSEEVILPAEPFADAVVGDKLIIHFTEYTADPQTWHQVELWTWIAEENAMGEALTNPGYHISPGDTECTFIITDNMLAALKAGIAAMAGTGYVLTAVDYESNADSDGTLWEGESVFTSWVPSVQVLIPASFFVTAKEGDMLIYTVKCNDASAWAAIRAEAGDWSGGIGDSDHVISSTSPIDVIVTLDANLLAQVQSKGIVMVGDNVTLTRVALVAAGGQQGTADYGTIWEGSLSFDNWNPSDDVSLKGEVFEGLVPGDKLAVTARKPNGNEWGAFRLEGGDTWAALAEQEYHELTGDAEQTVEVVMTPALIDDLKAHGLRFSGTNIVITKLVLVSGYAEPSLYGTLWQGSVSFVSWSPTGDLSIAASEFADVKAGDQLIVTAQKMSDGVWAALRAEGADWCGALAGQEYIELQDGEAQDIVIDITDALLADLKAHGLRFSGDNLTITKLALTQGEQGDSAYGTLWEGSVSFVSWSPTGELSVAADAFANAKMGDKLVVTAKKISEGVWGALRAEGADWCGALAGQEYIEIQEGDAQDIDIVITDALLADLKAHGLRFSGDNIVITKVALAEGGDVDPNAPLWEGSLSFVEWLPSADVCIKADKFAAAEVGYVILLTVEKIDVNVWSAIRLEGGDTWNALTGQEYLSVEYPGVQTLTVVIDEALLADLKAHGLRFSGDNLTLTKVELAERTSIRPLVSQPADDALYDLSGRQLDAPRGLYISGGKKYMAR